MLPTTIRTPPALADFTPLAEYQSQTPESFVGGKPILHYHVVGAKAWLPKSQCGSLPVFPADSAQAPSGPESENINGDAEELVEQKVDIFVNSE
jgi:nucleotide-sensitive chloride channel 1A